MTKAERVQVQNALKTRPAREMENIALEERISLAAGGYEAAMVASALREAECRMAARMARNRTETALESFGGVRTPYDTPELNQEPSRPQNGDFPEVR